MSLEVNIFHDGDPNQPLPPNSIGVIGTRGPQVMDGYVSFPNHDPREFFMTNDLGCLDSLGNLYFCGRNSDVVRSGAETILSAEVENTVSEKLQDVVSECAVFPYPDEKWGEVVAIVVVARSEHGGANSAVKNRINRGELSCGVITSYLSVYHATNPNTARFAHHSPPSQVGTTGVLRNTRNRNRYS